MVGIFGVLTRSRSSSLKGEGFERFGNKVLILGFCEGGIKVFESGNMEGERLKRALVRQEIRTGD